MSSAWCVASKADASEIFDLDFGEPANLSRLSQNFLTASPPVEAKLANAKDKAPRVSGEGWMTASSVGYPVVSALRLSFLSFPRFWLDHYMMRSKSVVFSFSDIG
jgi:hypothetical protein